MIIFFISHKSNIKILLKWLLKHFSFIECSHKNHHTNLEISCDVWISAKYRRCKRFDDSSNAIKKESVRQWCSPKLFCPFYLVFGIELHGDEYPCAAIKFPPSVDCLRMRRLISYFTYLSKSICILLQGLNFAWSTQRTPTLAYALII